MPSLGPSPSLPSIPPDLDEELTRYRWDPTYTMGKSCMTPFSRPTGGQLVFKFIPPMTGVRQVFGRDFRDVLSLDDLMEVLSNKKGSTAAELYRPLITDDQDKVVPRKVADCMRVFGVTSISQCKEWHKDYMSPVQPVLIYGACNVDNTDPRKQDTLRLPVTMCEIDPTDRVQDPIRYVYLTMDLPKGSSNWTVQFVITPSKSYINKRMMDLEGYSICYPLGLVDFINNGRENTRIHMFKGYEMEEPMWYIEGFVFNPAASWVIAYHKNPLDFYEGIPTFPDIWRTIDHDPNKRAIVEHIQKRLDEATPDPGPSPGDKRPHSVLPKRYKGSIGQRARFYGGGRLGSVIAAYNVTAGEVSLGGDNDVTGLPKYNRIKPNRAYKSPQPTSSATTITFSLSRSPPRNIGKAFMQNIMKPFISVITSNFFEKLNGYLETAMKNLGYSIKVDYLRGPGYSVTVDAKNIFLILAMEFVGRLRISSVSKSLTESIRKKIAMDGLFTGQLQKLRSLVNYFILGMASSTNNIFANERSVTFAVKTTGPNINKNNPITKPLAVMAQGPGIESVPAALHADFANSNFGGGVLGRGAVQEEILLITHPETLLGRAIFPKITDDIALEVMGAIMVSTFEGYGSSNVGRVPFTFKGPVQTLNVADQDKQGRALTSIVAFDAVNYSKNVFKQYYADSIKRAFNKALHAFYPLDGTDGTVPVVSGRWGGGVFHGDNVLIALIQIAAASTVNRPLILVRMTEPTAVAVRDIVTKVIYQKLTVEAFLSVLIEATANASYTRDMDKNENVTTLAIIQALGYETENLEEQLAEAEAIKKARINESLDMTFRLEGTDQPPPAEYEEVEEAPRKRKKQRTKQRKPATAQPVEVVPLMVDLPEIPEDPEENI